MLARIRRGFGRQRLRGPRLLAGNIRSRHGCFFYREQRFAGFAVEQEYKPLLRRLRYGINQLAVARYGYEVWWCRWIAVENIMMHKLKMPDALAGAGVERQQAVGKEVRTFAVA